jgi:hypothetical protein
LIEKSKLSKLIREGSIRNSTFFDNIGIAHRVSCPLTHQQKGSAEQKHKRIVETGLALLAHSIVPLHF